MYFDFRNQSRILSMFFLFCTFRPCTTVELFIHAGGISQKGIKSPTARVITPNVSPINILRRSRDFRSVGRFAERLAKRADNCKVTTLMTKARREC